VKHHNMQLENAAALVIDRFGKGAFEVGTDIVPAEKEEKQPGLPRDLMRSNEGIMDTLLEHIGTQEEFNRSLVERLDKQENFNSELMQRLDQQQKQFEERLQWMEKDREFVHSVRESMKQRQLESAEHENKTSSQLMNIENQLSEIQRKQNDNETGKELAEKVEELSNQLGQVQQAMKESAAAQQEQNKKGFFARLFGKK
jgi:Rad3-related DNA helicase